LDSTPERQRERKDKKHVYSQFTQLKGAKNLEWKIHCNEIFLIGDFSIIQNRWAHMVFFTLILLFILWFWHSFFPQVMDGHNNYIKEMILITMTNNDEDDNRWKKIFTKSTKSKIFMMKDRISCLDLPHRRCHHRRQNRRQRRLLDIAGTRKPSRSCWIRPRWIPSRPYLRQCTNARKLSSWT